MYSLVELWYICILGRRCSYLEMQLWLLFLCVFVLYLDGHFKDVVYGDCSIYVAVSIRVLVSLDCLECVVVRSRVEIISV